MIMHERDQVVLVLLCQMIKRRGKENEGASSFEVIINEDIDKPDKSILHHDECKEKKEYLHSTQYFFLGSF